jgi:hypothetical protein
MKLTTKIEEDIKQALGTYWKSYLIGDLYTSAGYLADNYHNIGITEEEIWNSKEQIWAYSKNVVHQLTGRVEFRNRELDYAKRVYQIGSRSTRFLAHDVVT